MLNRLHIEILLTTFSDPLCSWRCCPSPNSKAISAEKAKMNELGIEHGAHVLTVTPLGRRCDS